MLKEFISKELINQIQKELDEEYERLEKEWIDKIIDMNDIHEIMIADIYCDYYSIPIDRLTSIIDEKFTFLREIQLNPYLIVDINNCNINGSNYEIKARLHVGYMEGNYKKSNLEWEKFKEILEEIEEIYYSLDMNMELYLISCDNKIMEEEVEYVPNREHFCRIVGM